MFTVQKLTLLKKFQILLTNTSLSSLTNVESETIAVACILDCVWPELLRTWVVDVAEHSNVCFGDNVSY